MQGSIILAALLAAGLAIAANMVLKRAGYIGLAYGGPVFEELIKTGSAIIFNVSVPGTHILFGIMEAVGDYAWGGKWKILSAISGVIAHTIFGLVTYFLINVYPVYIALLGSITVHIVWNVTVLKLSAEREKR